MQGIRALFVFMTSFVCQGVLADVTQWIPFTLENGHILIPIRIAGEDGVALIDSGAEINGINAHYVEKNSASLSMGDKIRLKGVYGTEEKRMVNKLPINMFDVDMTLSNLVPSNIGRAKLLLGLPFLKNFIVQFDYPNQRMRILPPRSIDMSSYANVELRQVKGASLPAIRVQFSPDESEWLIMDTGNSGGLVLKRSTAERHGWLKNREITQSISFGATTAGSIDNFKIDYVKVGPFELENVLVSVPSEGQSSNIGERANSGPLSSGVNTKGLLGYDILKHFVLTLDLSAMKMHIGVPEDLGLES